MGATVTQGSGQNVSDVTINDATWSFGEHLPRIWDKAIFAPQIRLICEMNEKLASGASYALCNNILDSTQS